MTIQDLGSVSELVAALATVATLAYLALQIRRSNILGLAESQRVAATTPAMLSIAENADLARIWEQGLRDRSSLKPDEKARFDMLLANLMGGLSSSIIDQIRFGFHGDETVADSSSNVQSLLSAPGGAEWWVIYRRGYPKRFQRFVDEQIR